jgi:hypothetical protein
MSGIPTFFLHPVEDQRRVVLRRYSRNDASDAVTSASNPCPLRPGAWSYHDAQVVLAPASPTAKAESLAAELEAARADARWPTGCACGYVFSETDAWQANVEHLYRRASDGALFTLKDAPVGAMWDAAWYRGEDGRGGEPWTGPDGLSLVVKTPGGDWLVDQEASNCDRTQWATRPEGGQRWSGRTHYCWVRHGDPRTGIVHVDKNGTTCGAGAGSILTGGWHGFLHHGQLVGT